MHPILSQFFCYCGLPIYQDETKMFCKRHGKNYTQEVKLPKRGRYSGKSVSKNKWNEYE